MKIEITAESSLGGNSQKVQSSYMIAMQRPNLVAAKVAVSGFMPAREIYLDGKTVYTYAPNTKQFKKQASPPDFKGANVGLLGDACMLIACLYQDIDAMGQDVKVQFRGTQTIEGKQTRVVETTEKRGNLTSNMKHMLAHKISWYTASSRTRPCALCSKIKEADRRSNRFL